MRRRRDLDARASATTDTPKSAPEGEDEGDVLHPRFTGGGAGGLSGAGVDVGAGPVSEGFLMTSGAPVSTLTLQTVAESALTTSFSSTTERGSVFGIWVRMLGPPSQGSVAFMNSSSGGS